MIAPNYVLCASGTPSTPTLDVIINAAGDVEANNLSQRAVRTLAKAGYTGFTLYAVALPGETDFILATYTVETPEPIVTYGRVNNIGASKK